MAEDSLYTISIIANDSDFAQRLNAGAARENVPGDPVQWIWDRRYNLAAAPDWASKVDYWLANHPDEGNGWALDVSVISDIDITARIQELLVPEAPPPEQA